MFKDYQCPKFNPDTRGSGHAQFVTDTGKE